ncbi:Clavaminate synthase-like protein [Basidiobolus meristosporus CBS 931.73]|uniref:Clavaminate synthase-like protein n=1 Tax=Basidiobolus meristosporus CBS 931.73 TaxID=1314790 RepID=A0A1Y1XTX1_9FUNG|nr:Clavaminate synthase-like protein [Basidiobolus meristosporus CBS 931.73]|eukprot:ORX89188.1 Clavaminate synthase-like protein [Basidiobolus meristosporus CBS 931.73]
MVPEHTLASIYSTYLRVYFPATDDHADFHHFWLRHNCPCFNGCRHPQTGERIIDSTQIPLSVTPKQVVKSEDGVEGIAIEWDDGHASTYSFAFLNEYAYARNRQATPLPVSDTSKVEVDFQEYLEQYPPTQEDISAGHPLSAEGFKAYHKAIAERFKLHGAVVIRNRGLDTEQIIHDFIAEDKEVISSHFGRIEDLRTDNKTNSNTDQLGYTNHGVDLHTDLPYMEEAPGIQFLQCITPATEGGDSYLVNSVQSALYLRNELDRHAFDLLASIPIQFDRKQAKYQKSLRTPIIELTPGSTLEEPTIRKIRYSYFTMAPHQTSFELMEEWYRAYNRFSSFVRQPENQLRFSLKSGDLVLYNNYQMLHARTGFSGPRHFRGVYLNIDDFLAHVDA